MSKGVGRKERKKQKRENAKYTAAAAVGNTQDNACTLLLLRVHV